MSYRPSDASDWPPTPTSLDTSRSSPSFSQRHGYPNHGYDQNYRQLSFGGTARFSDGSDDSDDDAAQQDILIQIQRNSSNAISPPSPPKGAAAPLPPPLSSSIWAACRNHLLAQAREMPDAFGLLEAAEARAEADPRRRDKARAPAKRPPPSPPKPHKSPTMDLGAAGAPAHAKADRAPGALPADPHRPRPNLILCGQILQQQTSDVQVWPRALLSCDPLLVSCLHCATCGLGSAVGFGWCRAVRQTDKIELLTDRLLPRLVTCKLPLVTLQPPVLG